MVVIRDKSLMDLHKDVMIQLLIYILQRIIADLLPVCKVENALIPSLFDINDFLKVDDNGLTPMPDFQIPFLRLLGFFALQHSRWRRSDRY